MFPSPSSAIRTLDALSLCTLVLCPLLLLCDSCVSAFLPFCFSQSCAGRSPAREFEKQGRPLGTRRPLGGRPRDAPWEGDAPAEPNPLNRTPKPRTPTVTPSRDRDRRQADHWSPACQRRLPHGSAGASPSQGAFFRVFRVLRGEKPRRYHHPSVSTDSSPT
ncbi:MAG: hypothetical protein RLZZ458_2300, partial [Planctomycetota bacterium]